MTARPWWVIAPADAVDLVLPHPDVVGPVTMDGRLCRWPWEPPQLRGQPIGMFHCGFCGEMCVAGMDHSDYREDFETSTQRLCPACGVWFPLGAGGFVVFEHPGGELGEVCAGCAARLGGDG